MAEHPVGTVIHYFGKPQVGIVSLTADFSIGDTGRLRSHGAVKPFTLDGGRNAWWSS